MDVKKLQTEIATAGYGPTTVLHWYTLQSENPDFLPKNPDAWRQVFVSAKALGPEFLAIQDEALQHLLLH